MDPRTDQLRINQVWAFNQATRTYFSRGLSARIGTTSKLAVPLLERYVKALDALLESQWARAETLTRKQEIIQTWVEIIPEILILIGERRDISRNSSLADDPMMRTSQNSVLRHNFFCLAFEIRQQTRVPKTACTSRSQQVGLWPTSWVGRAKNLIPFL